MKNSRFPQLSKSWKDVESEMKAAQSGDMPWRDARNFKPAYFAGGGLTQKASAVAVNTSAARMLCVVCSV